jgi:hypothetical protein
MIGGWRDAELGARFVLHDNPNPKNGNTEVT